MRISLACNWKLDLLDLIENDPILKQNVYDLYGTYDLSFTGTGRPFMIMPRKSKLEVETYINKLHDSKLKFTWLWNGMCLGFYMFNSEEQTKALKELDWLEDLGVEYLTVTDPYLAEFAITHHPKLKIKSSVVAEVNSLARALEWQEIIGPEGVLTLSFMINRNFPLLKEIRNSVKCDVELLVNDCCLNDCPYRFFHYTECSHSSQTHDVLEAYYNDWAGIACQNLKCLNPEQILMCRWIQPSDLDKYLNIGIDYFKISGRKFGTKWLSRAVKAFSEKKYSANLGEILEGYSFIADPLVFAGGSFPEYAIKQEKMGEYSDDAGIMLSIPDFKAKLEANMLTDFVNNFPFEGARCAENCGVTCNYCHEFVKKAYSITSVENAESYKSYMAYLLDFINKGEMFLPKEKRKIKSPVKKTKSTTYVGVPWDHEAQKFLEEIMVLIPDAMRASAKKAICHIAETASEKKDLKKVNKDLLISVIIQLIPKPFMHDLLDFLLEKNIEISRFMSEEEINQAKSLAYGDKARAQKSKEKGLSKNVSKSIDVKIQDGKPKEMKIEIISRIEWEAYLKSFMNAYNELPELKPLLKPMSPLIFQYVITDSPEMNFWQSLDAEKMNWGMGQYSGPNAPKIIHKTDFETIKKVNSGETDPIQATMARKYFIEGDLTKLMACAPLLPLNAKAHSIVMKKRINH